LHCGKLLSLTNQSGIRLGDKEDLVGTLSALLWRALFLVKNSIFTQVELTSFSRIIKTSLRNQKLTIMKLTG